MQNKFKTLILAICTAGIYNISLAAPSNDSSAPYNNQQNISDDKVVLNFEDADIQTVIKAISKLSGKNFVIDPRVKGKVNIVSEKPVSKAESYKVLEGALRMQGYATVEADGVIKVLPEADAKTHDMVTGTDNSIRFNQGDQLVTKIFTIDNGSATQVSNAIRPLVSSNNAISVYPNNNALIVTDYASNIQRITKIINGLNATQATKIPPEVVTLKHAYASDVAQLLQSYQGVATGGGAANADSGPTVTVTVNPAGNSLILSSNNKNKLDEIKQLALSLDTENAKSNNNMHVVYLKNADAAHVAEVLNVLSTGQSDPDMSPSPAQRTLSDTSSAFSGNGGSGGGGGSFNGSSNPAPKSSGSSNNNANANSDKNAPKILIQAEPTTNALIIQAPEPVYRNLRMIIDMLDVRRVQVMIEALIADINATETGNFGIQWLGGAGNNKAGVGVLSNYGGRGSSIGSIATTALGLAKGGATGSPNGAGAIPGEVYVGLVTGTVEIGGQKIPGISALADMITSSSAGNVLGRPTLLTLDNEEASLFVGQNIGIPTGSYATTGGNSTVNPFNTVDRKDVGTVLRIKPLVTQSGAIQLSVYQEDSKLDPSSLEPTGVYAQNGPSILKRNLKTQLIVDDGQIIALGGMTEDTVSIGANGIPLLSSIPYLGWLFSWQSRSHIKRNLVIFLRPLIIRNEEGAKALTNQRYRYILEQQKAVHAEGNILLPEIKAVTFENQVPYDAQQLPAQNFKAPNEPIVDLRTDDTAYSTQKPMYKSVNDGITVEQTSPNSASIISNQ
jgi:general secretion pathway protein D